MSNYLQEQTYCCCFSSFLTSSLCASVSLGIRFREMFWSEVWMNGFEKKEGILFYLFNFFWKSGGN